MKSVLHRLAAPLEERQLVEALRAPSDIPVVPLAEPLDLTPFVEVVTALTAPGGKESAGDACAGLAFYHI